jgi:hypothetical protein
MVSGSNSAGRVTAFQAVGREFEPRLPLYLLATFKRMVYFSRFSVSFCNVQPIQMPVKFCNIPGIEPAFEL